MAWCSSLGPHSASEQIPELLLSRFDCEVQEHTIATHRFRILAVRNPDRLLEAITPQDFAVDERLPYWSELWTSGIALAEECLIGKPLDSCRVLDLGCGLGLAGIAAAARGAHVLLADYEPDALAFAAWNVRQNLPQEAQQRVALRVTDWRSPGSMGSFDRVLGADIVYERRHFVPLLDMLDTCLRPQGEVWIADPDRSLGREFLAVAAERGWQGETVKREILRRGRRGNVAMTRLARKSRS